MAYRVGGEVRYSLLDSGASDLRGVMWIEAGLGAQLVRWNDGDHLDRPDVETALLFQADGFGAHHHGGAFIGFRAMFAPAPDASATSGCAGSCARSHPSSVDHSYQFVVGFDLGR